MKMQQQMQEEMRRRLGGSVGGASPQTSQSNGDQNKVNTDVGLAAIEAKRVSELERRLKESVHVGNEGLGVLPLGTAPPPPPPRAFAARRREVEHGTLRH